MHVFAIVILTALTLSLQTIVAPRVEIFGARPDWLLVLVVFMALYAAPQRSIIAAWFVGICADLTTVERLGLMSVSYAVVAAVVTAMREHIFRYSMFTQAAVTFCLCALVQTAWLIYARTLYDWGDGAFTYVVLVAAYTALWAPLMQGAMLRSARLLGVPRPRRGPLDATVGSHARV